MSKSVDEIMKELKGSDKVDDTITGKGAFSKSGFGDLVSAMVNDTSFKVPTYGKDGQKTGEMSVSELLRADLAKTVDNAKYPQKSEASVLNQVEISTKGLTEAIPVIIEEWIKTGRKFDLPAQPKFNGSVYLTDVKASTKTGDIRDMKTNEKIGTYEAKYDDSIKVTTKSPVPAHLTKKVTKDLKGNIIKK